MVYVAVPSYGIIRDLVGPGEAVFVLNPPPQASVERPFPGIIERVREILSPPEIVDVPVLQRIDLKGQVLYTDKTPYVNGIIEMRSEPQYTRTDLEGFFVFYDLAEGVHTVNVLDEAGNVLATARIDIHSNIEIKEAEIIRISDGTLVIQVAVDLKVLEITLVLARDGEGKVTGIELIELGIVPTAPTASGAPPIADNLPETVAEGDSFNFGVYDTATKVRYGSEGAVSVNIFGAKKRIAPGMRGSYTFTVDNGRNDYPSRYDVTFTVNDTLPDSHKIPMLYRLKTAEGVYVAGSETAWCKPEELYQDSVLEGQKDMKYTLDWYWPDGPNDNKFAQYAGYSYTLTITVKAQRQ